MIMCHCILQDLMNQYSPCVSRLPTSLMQWHSGCKLWSGLRTLKNLTSLIGAFHGSKWLWVFFFTLDFVSRYGFLVRETNLNMLHMSRKMQFCCLAINVLLFFRAYAFATWYRTCQLSRKPRSFQISTLSIVRHFVGLHRGESWLRASTDHPTFQIQKIQWSLCQPTLSIWKVWLSMSLFFAKIFNPGFKCQV